MRSELFARGEPSRRTLAEALDALADTDLRDGAGRVAQPALVVAGARDTLTPAPAGAWLAAAMPQGRLALIDGAAHVPFLSHPGEFANALSGFLDAR
jgi:pimeloyl-[acyl-carrier protein] methyl ester esterase